jgi:hypothetical protein
MGKKGRNASKNPNRNRASLGQTASGNSSATRQVIVFNPQIWKEETLSVIEDWTWLEKGVKWRGRIVNIRPRLIDWHISTTRLKETNQLLYTGRRNFCATLHIVSSLLQWTIIAWARGSNYTDIDLSNYEQYDSLWDGEGWGADDCLPNLIHSVWNDSIYTLYYKIYNETLTSVHATCC